MDLHPCGDNQGDDIFGAVEDLISGIDEMDEGQREVARAILRRSPRVGGNGRCPEDWED